MTEQLAAHLLNAAAVVEQKLDQEINRLDQLDDDEMEVIRRKRMTEMKKAQDKKAELIRNGHGKLTELADEREFFDVCKKCPTSVCLFYEQQTDKCQVVEKALQNLSQTHFFTKFTKINVEKCKFLVERLRLQSVPVIAIVVGERVGDYIRLADKLNKSMDSIEHDVEQRLYTAGAIDRCRLQPEKGKSKQKSVFGQMPGRRGIRGGMDDESDTES